MYIQFFSLQYRDLVGVSYSVVVWFAVSHLLPSTQAQHNIVHWTAAVLLARQPQNSLTNSSEIEIFLSDVQLSVVLE